MTILIAFERSGIVRDAFIELGYDAVSCDLAPTERPGPHIQGDARPLLREPWDLVIAHPPCNYLTLYTWTFKNQDKVAHWWRDYGRGLRLFIECLRANAPLVAVENPPMMHPPARHIIGPPDQSTDFSHFDCPYRKRVGLWLKGLPPLLEGMRRPDAQHLVKDRSAKFRRENSPKPSNRGAFRYSSDRSRFQPEMARAMALQWGTFIHYPLPPKNAPLSGASSMNP